MPTTDINTYKNRRDMDLKEVEFIRGSEAGLESGIRRIVHRNASVFDALGVDWIRVYVTGSTDNDGDFEISLHFDDGKTNTQVELALINKLMPVVRENYFSGAYAEYNDSNYSRIAHTLGFLIRRPSAHELMAAKTRSRRPRSKASSARVP